MSYTHAIIFIAFIASTYAQRSPYAGLRPVGIPALQTQPIESNGLGDRFGNGATSTTQRLPIEALGDAELVRQINKLPVDNQPFWYLNWRALEEHRKNPQTYPHKENGFNKPLNFDPSFQQNFQSARANTMQN